MADYSQSLKDDPDVAPRKREQMPSLVPLYIISFVLLSGAIIAFIEVGNSLSVKQSSIQTLQTNVTNLQTSLSALTNSFNAANAQLSSQINSTNQNIVLNASALQASINKLNTSLTNQINGNSGQIQTLNSEYSTLNTNVGTLTTNVGTLTTQMTTANTNIQGLQTNLNSLNSTVSGLTAPTHFKFSPVLPTTLNVVSKTPTSGTTYASSDKNLTSTSNGYLACSTAFAFYIATNLTLSVDLGYVLGNSTTWNNIYSSSVVNATANFAFATVNIPVTSTMVNQTINFQVAFQGSSNNTTTIDTLTASASCSLFL